METVETSPEAVPLDPVSRVEEQVAELERTVQEFEDAAALVERCVDEIMPGDGASLQPLTQALCACQEAVALVEATNQALNDALVRMGLDEQAEAGEPELAPLPIGTLICDERYRLLQLLHKRPRVHLYLARRLRPLPGMMPASPSLVVIRELLLDGLTQEARRGVVRSAFEEFAAPQFFGSPHLAGVGDHVHIEEGRHYLVMQPRPARGRGLAFAQPLSEVLAGHPQGSAWPNLPTALLLATRLCQTIARLHRARTFLGELTPEMLLVDRSSGSSWSPLLLASWPPALSFWPESATQEAQRLYAQTFPFSEQAGPEAGDERPFAAPEIFEGRCDERSDVYALGALLYLLLTGCAPATASARLRAISTQSTRNVRKERQTSRRSRKTGTSSQTDTPKEPDLALILPCRLNTRISPLLEQILLRALDLNPQQRFASAQDLAEALEGLHLKGDISLSGAPAPLTQAKVSRLRKLLEWLRI